MGRAPRSDARGRDWCWAEGYSAGHGAECRQDRQRFEAVEVCTASAPAGVMPILREYQSG